jgi:hypothetical protein
VAARGPSRPRPGQAVAVAETAGDRVESMSLRHGSQGSSRRRAWSVTFVRKASLFLMELHASVRLPHGSSVPAGNPLSLVALWVTKDRGLIPTAGLRGGTCAEASTSRQNSHVFVYFVEEPSRIPGISATRRAPDWRAVRGGRAGGGASGQAAACTPTSRIAQLFARRWVRRCAGRARHPRVRTQAPRVSTAEGPRTTCRACGSCARSVAWRPLRRGSRRCRGRRGRRWSG